ncbi:hypothetical protein ASPWEDRAFT_54768 [Aspergillus wentii DTO 134E9]|uniref:3-phytase n=1 Tax=Aspergillus wentii DTO 134E9 TaxID=1073089 RepID=A0A1L9R9T8_ASPWE|nr:uncharacterized protein ASPWEDRAFT_54768 [Aspergillus wentii DTO 134E9]OJJ31682.1 hypothetical protein ASPWEDRAFT_54768 [Aspergillus wentii DTO 134E9]
MKACYLTIAERVLGAYVFQRHGDRTAEAWPPTKLSILGYGQDADIVNLAQVIASAPQDYVIKNPGDGFLPSCNNAKVGRNSYFPSNSFKSLLSSSRELYRSLEPLVNELELNYKNGYTSFLFLRTSTSFNIAYNSSDEIRAVAGMTLDVKVLTGLNEKIISGGKSKLNIQFSAYASFISYFGLVKPQNADEKFAKLVRNDSGTGIPPTSDIRVRFMFHNETSVEGSTQLQAYLLFGQSTLKLPSGRFVEKSNQVAISSQQQWCQACGNTTGVCASTSDDTGGDSSSSSSSSLSSSNSEMSLGVAGVIGAMVTLCVPAGLLCAHRYLSTGCFSHTVDERFSVGSSDGK